jgi:uncharacterized protein (DUF427 family)
MPSELEKEANCKSALVGTVFYGKKFVQTADKCGCECDTPVIKDKLAEYKSAASTAGYPGGNWVIGRDCGLQCAAKKTCNNGLQWDEKYCKCICPKEIIMNCASKKYVKEGSTQAETTKPNSGHVELNFITPTQEKCLCQYKGYSFQGDWGPFKFEPNVADYKDPALEATKIKALAVALNSVKTMVPNIKFKVEGHTAMFQGNKGKDAVRAVQRFFDKATKGARIGLEKDPVFSLGVDRAKKVLGDLKEKGFKADADLYSVSCGHNGPPHHVGMQTLVFDSNHRAEELAGREGLHSWGGLKVRV